MARNRIAPGLFVRALEARTRRPRTGRPITIVLHPRGNPGLNAVFLAWVERNFPAAAATFVFRSLPLRPRDVTGSGAVVFWLQDPIAEWSTLADRQVLAVAEICAHAGVPMVNRPSLYAGVDRLDVPAHLAAAGFRTPRVTPILDWDELFASADGLDYPFVLRDATGHQRLMRRIERKADLLDPALRRLARPIRTEWVDVANGAGQFRKYRTLVVGERVLPLHVHISNNWITRGGDRATDEAAQAEELGFLAAPAPCAEAFLTVARRTGLEVLAYDFGRTPTGEIVVWEANPYPFIWFSGADGKGLYRAAAIHRAFAALLELYLRTAGHAVPQLLQDVLSGDPETAARATAGLVAVVRSKRLSIEEEIALRRFGVPETSRVGYRGMQF